MKLLITYGTRPEWIKIKPILDKLKNTNIQYKTLFTGQHKDLLNTNADFILPNIIDTNKNRLNDIVISILTNISDILNNFTHVLVQGDTTSVLAISLAAFHSKVKVIHLEAGLRTYDNDNPYPEEFNRSAVSKLVSIHLCPTENNKQNLIQEKIQGDIYVIGNTVLDNLTNIKTNYGNDIIITLHRRENHNEIKEWFKIISKIALDNKDLNFILPIHPNPNVYKFKHILEGVNIIDPVPYKEMINLIANCKFIITDSGGIQEEASFLNKKAIVCRKMTERPESINIHSFMCNEYIKLESIFYDINNDYIVNAKCPYGDGNSTEKIINILETL